jgi:glycolate oxidase iron-sulfur subunit
MRAALAKLPTRIPPLDPVGANTQSYMPTQQINNENNNKSKNESTQKIRRVALLAGCAQRALDPEINASTIRVLNRLGIEVVVRSEAHCCGALAHHIGETEAADKSV